MLAQDVNGRFPSITYFMMSVTFPARNLDWNDALIGLLLDIVMRASRFVRRHQIILIFLSLFIITLLPRLVAIGRYITPDELIWVYRTVLFREALLEGRWTDMMLSGHPGVTTMWLGMLGVSLQLLFRPQDGAVYQWLTQLAWLTPDNMTAYQQLAVFLSAARFFVAVTTSLGVMVVYGLARPLLGTTLALFAALLLALDPFLAGLSGLLHVDALMTTFAAISLLALARILASEDERGWRRLALLAGGAAGLAILSKSPTLLLLPVTAVTFLYLLWHGRRQPFKRPFGDVIWTAVFWLAAFALVTAVLFPALWATPLQVINVMSSNANRHVAEALRPTFFMGEVAYNHGALFYPVVLLWRLGPVVFVGLILLPMLLIWGTFRLRTIPEKRHEMLSTIVLLLLWTVLFLGGINFAAKKFDRYVLPVIPALTMLAVIAWGWLVPRQSLWRRWLLLLLTLGQTVYLAWFFFYPLAAYNPLVGGPATAVAMLPLGWGESISASGNWLADEGTLAGETAVSGIAPSLAPFFPGTTLLAEAVDPRRADYLIFTANSYQVDPSAVEAATADLQRLKVIHYGGLDQAWIYRNPQPESPDVQLDPLAASLSFAGQIILQATQTTVAEREVDFYAQWALAEGYGHSIVRLQLRDEVGNLWQELETPLLNEVYFYPEYWQPDETPQIHYVLDLPPAMPPGLYLIALSLFDEATNAQLPVLSADGDFLGVTTTVGEVKVQRPLTPPKATDLTIAIPQAASWAAGDLDLLGHSELPRQVANGSPFTFDLFWQVQEPLTAGLQLSVQLAGETPIILPLSRFDTGLWQSGDLVQEKYSVVVPPDMAAGEIAVQLRPLLADGTPLEGTAVTMGTIEIQAVDRLFALPSTMKAELPALFEQNIYLRGANWAATILSPGDSLPLTLFWQTTAASDELLSTFVHVIAPDGSILAQADRWPGGLPSNTWATEQVIVDEYEIPIPENAAPGDYQIAVGLYTAVDGRRLQATDGSGHAYVDNQFLLPFTLTIDDVTE